MDALFLVLSLALFYGAIRYTKWPRPGLKGESDGMGRRSGSRRDARAPLVPAARHAEGGRGLSVMTGIGIFKLLLSTWA